MSQKKETTILLLALLITLGLIGIGFWIFNLTSGKNSEGGYDRQLRRGDIAANTEVQKPPISFNKNNNRISFGETIFTPGEPENSKKKGFQALKEQNYDQAITDLSAAIKAKPNDPETLIALNNAKIKAGENYGIAVAVPFSTEPNVALEVLRGVAQAQNDINAKGGIKGTLLKIAIANDDDNPQIAKTLAADLAKNKDILGVVGHFSSDVTLAAGEIYKSEQLVAISAVSTSVEISKQKNPYVFRTVPSDFIAARALANHMATKLQKKNVAVFFNSASNYSQSLKSEFVSSVSLEGGQVSGEFDFSQPDFSAAKSLEQAARQGAEVIMLASNVSTLDKALQVVQVNQKKLPILAGDDMYSLKTLEISKQQAEGMVVAIPWHIDGNAKSEFPQVSRQLWGADVNWRTALAYDATRALIAALELEPSRTGIQKSLSSTEFSTTGASGTIRFLPSGDRNASVQLVRVAPGTRSGTGFDFIPN
ncbi:ABC transporter substrate-binding protein [Calothrix sp. PCC 6303]|uniref:ABC transporter substrate-binding protein n=1 Tax=Calothrix sp. PCC 6303 TaxID=1170562 RepID=UPI0002A01522|nr:ABC transporter substrate-binding protein [Calothrix sp. PCC 6303]AFZ00807.1 amino acid/amide ABC transporter substrate-binding protein, HAAT family [Calothrix sp. PCC 6303]